MHVSNDRETGVRVRQRALLKWIAIMSPASAITFALFVAMTRAVAVEYVEPTDLPTYDLDAYVETPRIDDPRPTIVKPIRQDVLDPPPIPKPISTKIKVDLEPIDYLPNAEPVQNLPVLKKILSKGAAPYFDKNLRPIQHPIPVYPRKAASMGLEGFCDVSLSVTPRGDPFNVQAECTDRVFESAAERAVKKSKFTPKIVDGTPVTVVGVVYPLEFRLE
jgi:protein TonB